MVDYKKEYQMYSLRGIEAKKKFIKEYEKITPLFYTVVLSGKTIKNQCGGILTDRYYQFSAINKSNDIKEIFYVGYDCGEQLLNMLNIDVSSIKLFNPLKQDNYNANTNLSKGNGISCDTEDNEDSKLRQELYTLCFFTCIGLKLKDESIITNITEWLRENPNEDPKPYNFKSINTLLLRFNSSMESILQEIKREGKLLKEFNFDISREYLKAHLKRIKNQDEIRF